MITSESLQYFSHDSRKQFSPPISHNFIIILPEIDHVYTFLDYTVIEADGRYGILFERASWQWVY
jgi:hypothetical protein